MQRLRQAVLIALSFYIFSLLGMSSAFAASLLKEITDEATIYGLPQGKKAPGVIDVPVNPKCPQQPGYPLPKNLYLTAKNFQSDGVTEPLDAKTLNRSVDDVMVALYDYLAVCDANYISILAAFAANRVSFALDSYLVRKYQFQLQTKYEGLPMLKWREFDSKTQKVVKDDKASYLDLVNDATIHNLLGSRPSNIVVVRSPETRSLTYFERARVAAAPFNLTQFLANDSYHRLSIHGDHVLNIATYLNHKLYGPLTELNPNEVPGADDLTNYVDALTAQGVDNVDMEKIRTRMFIAAAVSGGTLSYALGAFEFFSGNGPHVRPLGFDIMEHKVLWPEVSVYLLDDQVTTGVSTYFQGRTINWYAGVEFASTEAAKNADVAEEDAASSIDFSMGLDTILNLNNPVFISSVVTVSNKLDMLVHLEADYNLSDELGIYGEVYYAVNATKGTFETRRILMDDKMMTNVGVRISY